MEVVRQYKNAAEDLIRVDTIIMERKQDAIAADINTHTFQRILRISLVHGTGLSDRVVAAVDIIGDYTSIEVYTGSFTWAQWTSPPALVNMSDLPQVGDTV